MHKLHDLKKMILENLEEFADKGVTNATDLKTVDIMAHAAKNLGKVIEMCEEEDSGSSFRRGSYRGGSYRGSYDDRPRVGGYQDNAYRRRDSMGRYAREGEGSSYETGYAEASNEMRNMLDTMLRDARSDQERKTIREMMEQLDVRG